MGIEGVSRCFHELIRAVSHGKRMCAVVCLWAKGTSSMIFLSWQVRVTLLDVMKHPRLRMRLLIMTLCWFVVSMVSLYLSRPIP